MLMILLIVDDDVDGLLMLLLILLLLLLLLLLSVNADVNNEMELISATNRNVIMTIFVILILSFAPLRRFVYLLSVFLSLFFSLLRLSLSSKLIQFPWTCA